MLNALRKEVVAQISDVDLGPLITSDNMTFSNDSPHDIIFPESHCQT